MLESCLFCIYLNHLVVEHKIFVFLFWHNKLNSKNLKNVSVFFNIFLNINLFKSQNLCLHHNMYRIAGDPRLDLLPHSFLASQL